jgi:hypothetical protein
MTPRLRMRRDWKLFLLRDCPTSRRVIMYV